MCTATFRGKQCNERAQKADLCKKHAQWMTGIRSGSCYIVICTF
jgi:hypothetical protein